MARTKRLLASAEKLQRMFGNVKLSVAIDRLRNPRPGRPTKWTERRVFDVYIGVEACRSEGLSITAACRVFAVHSKLSKNVVEDRHQHGALLREFLWDDKTVTKAINVKKRALATTKTPAIG